MSDLNDPNTILPQAPKMSPLRQFVDDVMASLTEPRRFYTERYPQLSFNYALAMGLAVNWLASILKWMTRILNHETFMDGFLKIRDQLQQLPMWKDLPPSIWAQNPAHSAQMIPGWIAEAASVALHPFSFLISVVISALALSIGAWLFVPRTPVVEGRDRPEISQLMKLSALASTPVLVGAILSFLPLGLGSVVGVVYSFFMLLFALSIRYRVSMLRAFAVVATPWFALVMIGACVIGVFGALIFGFLASVLGF